MIECGIEGRPQTIRKVPRDRLTKDRLDKLFKCDSEYLRDQVEHH